MSLDLRVYQRRVLDWGIACFGTKIALSREERNYRFLEEAIELVQANGCPKEKCIELIDYAYSRPVGLLSQEAGGVIVTLSLLCAEAGVELATSADDELTRIRQHMKSIREKQAAKPIRGSVR